MNLLHVSPTPHERGRMSVRHIMFCVILALLPTTIAGCITFGNRAVLLLAVCVCSSVIWEALCRILMKRDQTIGDCSAALTGLLLGLSLSPLIPIWQALVGTFTAIVVVKQLFGGLGQNFANPAATARIVMLVSFQGTMTSWLMPQSDAVISATPLVTKSENYMDLLFGNSAGCIGETCAIALILGGLYLWLRGIISCAAPVGMIATVALFSFLIGENPLYQVLSGGLLLGAIFMATDYVTTPITKNGKLIFGIGCGFLTCVIRFWGTAYPEGVSFSILLMNLLTPYIDRLTKTIPFGSVHLKKEAAKS